MSDETPENEENANVEVPKEPETIEERIENLEKDVVELMEEREDMFSEIDKLRLEIGRASKLMGSAGNAVSSKDDKALSDVAQKFKR